LKDNDVHDNPQHVINIIALKGGAANPLVAELNTYGIQKHPYTAIDTQDPDSIVLISLRSTFPVSDIVAFENWKKAYFETAQGLKEEQFHRAMWRRFIPLPGAKITVEDARRYIAMAFVIDRLIHQVRGSTNLLQYAEFDPSRPEVIENCRLITLGGTIEEIKNYFQTQYPLLVEFFSLYYEISFQLKGPQWLEQKLLDLDSRIGSTDRTSLVDFVASFIDHDTIKELVKRLDWLVDQISPQQMYYFKN
jgi:signal peptidase I